MLDCEGENMDFSVDRWYSLTEIKEYLGISRDSVLNWIAEKNMPAHKIGRLWKFKISEVDEWVRADKEKTQE